MPRYETTRGYLTTVEKAAIVRERRGDEPRSSTQVAVKAVSVVQRTTHSIYCELRSLPCSVKYPKGSRLRIDGVLSGLGMESKCGKGEAVSRPFSLVSVVGLTCLLVLIGLKLVNSDFKGPSL